MSDPAPPASASDPGDQADLLILGSASQELSRLIRALGLRPHAGLHRGSRGPSRLLAAMIGVGPHVALPATEALLNRCRPRAILSVGFAGGLHPQLQPGQCLIPHCVLGPDHACLFLHSRRPPDPVAVPDRFDPDRPALLSSPVLADSVAAKQRLFAAHHALAVDMETFALAQLAARHHIPFRSLRAVSDAADETLPAQSVRWVRPDGSVNFPALAADVLRRPALIPVLARLHARANAAAQALADHAPQLIDAILQPD